MNIYTVEKIEEIARQKGWQVRTYLTDHTRQLQIQPKGFWTDAVKVWQDTHHWPEAKHWKKCTFSWGSGGCDGTLSPIDTIRSIQEAMDFAIEVAQDWNTDEE